MNELEKIRHYFFYFSAFVIIVGGLKFASKAIIILFLAIFIASIISSALVKLQKIKVPKFLSYIIVFFFITMSIFFVIYVINTSFKDFSNNLPFYEVKLKDLITNIINWLGGFGFSIDPNEIKDNINLAALFNLTATTAGTIGLLLSKMLLIFIGVAFILAEGSNFERKLDIIFKGNIDSKENFQLFSHNIQKYFTIKTLTSLLTGAFITTFLIFFEIDYPILWGFLGFILNFIPVVGSLIAAIPPLLLALISLELTSVAWLAFFYVLINNLISNVLEPKFMGQGLGLSAAVIFFSLIFWGWVLGPAGMFLAVPLTMTLKIAFDSNQNTKWIGILFSNLSKKKKSDSNEL